METATEIFYPATVQDWRAWLEQHHATATSVWVVFYKKASGMPTLTWSEAVDAALCYGWIDSKKIAVDHERSQQFFSRRKPGSTWSKINKDKIEKLEAAGLMNPAGLAAVARAKEDGSWDLLNMVDAREVPPDLAKAFRKQRGSKAYFASLSPSAQKMLLQWLVLAKRPETRQKRVEEIAACAALGKKPGNF
ncbi:MAG: hypothetical protein EOO16_11525 [Chitinophagaceae bacterium]|nr:MAG: hypothetical protein EOO16_11525 [Chitinophagaceae bacterium]